MAESDFHDIFPHGPDTTPYRKLTGDYVAAADFAGERIVKVDPKALTLLAQQGFVDCQHLLRPGHLQQLRDILDDPEASDNDRFVAFDLLKNANIAAGKVLPMCQDTGTAIVMGKKGQRVWTGGGDAAALASGIRRTFTETNLRYSQVAPLDMYEEVNTGDNLPAQIDLYADRSRRLVLGRPPDPRQDHRGGRLPRRAREQPRPLPARDRRGEARRRGRAHRSHKADGGDPPHPLAASDQDAAGAHRPADRRPRHPPCQAEGAARPRRGAAAIRRRA